VLQAEEAFSFGDNIVDAGGAHWGRAGQLRGGETIFGCMELEGMDISVPGDDGELKPYLLIVNSFGGFTPFCGILAYVRPVCQNTFQMAYGTKTPHRFAIRHTGTLDGKLAMARDALGIAFRHTAETKEAIDRLAMARIVDAQVQELFETVVWPLNPDAPQGMKDNSNASKAFSNYLTSETIDGIRGTAWGVYNAVTEYVDHLTEYKPKRGEGGFQTGNADELRTFSAILDGGAKRKDVALKALLALAK
jgi:phage/plasmid-like protein (TIGR03299 family)